MTFAAVAVAAGALALIAFVGTGALPPVTGELDAHASHELVECEPRFESLNRASSGS